MVVPIVKRFSKLDPGNYILLSCVSKVLLTNYVIVSFITTISRLIVGIVGVLRPYMRKIENVTLWEFRGSIALSHADCIKLECLIISILAEREAGFNLQCCLQNHRTLLVYTFNTFFFSLTNERVLGLMRHECEHEVSLDTM